MNFKDRTTTKKGDYAEDLVQNHLEKQNFAIYRTHSERSHPFDMIATGNYHDALNGKFYGVDAKAKSKRMYYQDTGIDTNVCDMYSKIKEKFRFDAFYLFFIDEKLKMCYYGELDDLKEEHKGHQYTHKFMVGRKTTSTLNRLLEYPIEDKGITYFHLDKMTKAFNLTEENIRVLISLTTKADRYK